MQMRKILTYQEQDYAKNRTLLYEQDHTKQMTLQSPMLGMRFVLSNCGYNLARVLRFA